jgi:hypothetical protein
MPLRATAESSCPAAPGGFMNHQDTKDTKFFLREAQCRTGAA